MANMGKRKGRNGERDPENENDENKKGEGVMGYEQFRAQRIKENQQRMQRLGILDLSRQLKSQPVRSNSKPSCNKFTVLRPFEPRRRSSRLQTMIPVSYSERRSPKKEPKLLKDVEIHVREGSNPEIYTEEHEKLLGDSKTTWTLLDDGFDEDGGRLYDPYQGKTCYQCRQKTIGRHTDCRKCKQGLGQFCGDCLYTRYGENAIEVNENPVWICPVCRGICNCSRCRREKGWEPTGSIYRKVLRLGFKSVAHYLIQTRQSQKNQGETADGNQLFEVNVKADDRSYWSAETEAKFSLRIAKPESAKEKNEVKGKEDSDVSYDGDDGNEYTADDDSDCEAEFIAA